MNPLRYCVDPREDEIIMGSVILILKMKCGEN